MKIRPVRKLSIALLAALVVPAAAAVSLTSYQLTSGYGIVEMVPGTNVTHYVVFGDELNNPASGTAYAHSGGSNPISPSVSSDRDLIYSDYPSGSVSFSGSAGIPAAGSTAGKFLKMVVPLSTGYGGVGATTASVDLTAPVSDFRFELLVHNYYAGADMQVKVGGNLVAEYANVMSSTGSRNFDYLYALSFTGLTVGEEIEVSFVNLQNLGSSWSNIGLFAASINLETPTQFEGGTVVTPTNAVPEPTSAMLISVLGLTWLLRRRRA